MVKFVKQILYTPATDRDPNSYPKKVLVVLQDEVGWLYLKKLVQVEGLLTPFRSIEEIEIYLDEDLAFLDERKLDS